MSNNVNEIVQLKCTMLVESGVQDVLPILLSMLASMKESAIVSNSHKPCSKRTREIVAIEQKISELLSYVE